MSNREAIRYLPILTSERLKLRPLTVWDIDDVFAYTSDPDVAQFIRRPLHVTHADSEAYVRTFIDAAERGEVSPWGIEHLEDGKIIGTCGFYFVHEGDKRAEIGYAVSRAYWKHGYATEAVRSLLSFGFNTLMLNRIDAACWVENRASAHVLEKVGMQFEGLRRQYIYVKGAFRDLRWYSLLREEYLA